MADLPKHADSDQFYLPDLCATRTVFAIVMIAELVAIILTVAGVGGTGDFWVNLAKISLFLLWIGLSSAFALCVSRPWLARLGGLRATLISFVLLLATTALIAEATYWTGRLSGMTDSGFPARQGEFLIRALIISAIISAMVLRYLYVSHQWKRNVRREARARIDALQARIRPHFLFNSMNTIAALTRSNPELAEEAIEDLADLFRANLSDQRNQIPLKQELEVARIYQRIEQLRLGERLRVEWAIADLPARAMIPSLTVQPLLENAIYHGIEPLPEGGTVRVSGSYEDGTIRLSVANPLPPQGDYSQHKGNRVALSNIEQRLELAYQGKGRLDVDAGGDQYRVTLSFPHIEEQL